MNELKELLTSHTQWLADHITDQASRYGVLLNPEASPVEAVGDISKTMVETLDSCGLDGCDLPLDKACSDGPLAEFPPPPGECRLEGGLTSAIGLAKLYRQAYIHLIEQHLNNTTASRPYTLFINRFFDRMELGQCSNWAQARELERQEHLKAAYQSEANERKRFRALFDSLASPVFLLDSTLNIELMNQAAADFLGDTPRADELGYACATSIGADPDSGTERTALKQVLPWLADAIEEQCTNNICQGQRNDIAAPCGDETRYFSISISDVAATSDDFSGHTVVLTDVTARVEAERQVARERNQATHYLDVVGSIVVAMDTTGTIILINKTGCRILGYEEHELIGQNWIDIAVPPELRDELRDYLHHITSEDREDDDQHTNYDTTRSGEDRLIEWTNRILRNDENVPVGILASGVDITEQRAMEEALFEKELWLRNTFMALGEAVLILTPDNRVLDANPAAETVFRMTNEELCNGELEDLHVDRAHYVAFDEKLQTSLHKGKALEFEFTMRRKTGEVFPVALSTSLITADDNSPLGTVCAIRDITRQKKAAEELRNSEAKFRRIFNTIEEGFVVTDLDGTIEMVNPATCALLGYDEKDLIGQSMGILYANPDERNHLRSALEDKKSVNGLHLSAARKDGSIITVEANAHMVMDETGRPMGMEGTFRDITARLEAESLLREREKQYRAFFENNHAIMLLEDPKTGEIVDANPAASDFYGYSLDEMRTMNVTLIQAQTEEEIYEEMWKAHNQKRSYFIFKHRLANGEVRDVEVYSGPILVGGNQLLYSVIHDVTERIRLEKDMKRMATTDSLTGASNRHQFFELGNQEMKRSLRYNHPMAILMLDIDYFKNINDTFGHQTGDIVLRALTAMARATLRKSDIFGRVGGEEFAAILPETSIMSAFQVAERLRQESAKLTIRDQDEDVSFTVSIGVAAHQKGDRIIEDILARADEALYKAKRKGRNRVERG